MKKIQNTARITACLCLFFALFFVVFLGIPFLNVPAVTNTSKMNVAPDLTTSYTLTLVPGENFETAQQILSARLNALPYDDVTLTQGENQTLLLTTPRYLGGAITTIAQTICGTGKITYTDNTGKEVIPAEAVERAQVGYGILDPSLNTPVYYLEFFLKDEYRQTFREATKELSEAETGQNIMSVNMDGSAILQATVSEEMTEESFIMGGNFSDAILPNLYAAYVNTPALDQTVSYGDTNEIAPTLGKSTYPALIFGLFIVTLLAGLLVFLVFRRLTLPVFLTLLIYTFSFLLFFQISSERVSAPSFLAAFFCILLLCSLFFIIAANYKKEIRIGRDNAAAFHNAVKNSTLPLFLCFGAWALLSGIIFAFSGSASLWIRDFLFVLFMSSLFALLFGYGLFRLFLYLQQGLHHFQKNN